MFTQCPECKTIFGFNEEHTQVAGGKVRCSQCSHVFDAMAHSMAELPNTDNDQPATEETPVPSPESNEIVEEPVAAEEPAVAEEPTVDETSADAEDDDAFSLFDDANDFMEAISDDFERPESSVEENIVFNELGDTKTPTKTEANPEPVTEEATEQTADDVTPEPGKSTIEAAMAEDPATSVSPEPEEEIKEEVSTTPEETSETEPVTEALTEEEEEADKLAAEWGAVLDAEEETETTPEAEASAEPAAEETPETVEEPTGVEEAEVAETSEATEAVLDAEEETETTPEVEASAEPATEEPVAAESTEPTEEVTLSESEDEKNGLDENSSLQNFLQSQLEDLDDAPKAGPEEAEALDIAIDSLTGQGAESPAEEKPAEQPITELANETPDSLIEDFIPPEDKSPSWGITLVWAIAILASLVLLTSQYVYTMRDELSQIPSIRPSVIKFCELTECTVPLYSNLEQLEFISQDVRSHPRYQNALMVTVIFINKSPFYQAYPVIQFQLSDIDQNPAAGRYFLPNTYLDTSVDIKAGIKPETPIRAVIEINDPGEKAINYDFDFR